MSSGVPLGTQAARESSGSRRSIRPFRATPLSPTTARRVSRSGSSMGGARTWRVQVSDAAGHVDVFTIVAPTSRSAEQAAEVRFLDNGHLGHGGLKIDECRVQC
ncbi:MAG: hypothetical protein HZA54_19770 [Planctomycetes bacterium]|nr:hypothetical protein [Planctomycetota bacterium]